jgi:ssRNA-specific RNase YbeY (16S rRNA maturation enzyme)
MRVLIHGVLHLVGYDDRDDESRSEMRRMEDFWLGSL